MGLQAFCQIYGGGSPEAAMRVACAALLETCGTEKPPVPLKPLFEKLGVRIKKVRREAKHANQAGAVLLAAREGLTVCLYESGAKSNWRRQRFTLAHEIGHVILLRALNDSALIESLDSSPAAHRQLESLCDIAASEILLPARAVRNALRKFDLTPSGLAMLYDLFLVSKEALVRRLGAIMPHSAVVKWQIYSRSDNEKAEMRVVRSFPGYSREGSRPWLPVGCSTRHLDPPIVQWAASQREPVLEDNLKIFLRGRSQECVGLATFFPSNREPSRQPRFEGFEVPDEADSRAEILLFVADKVMAGGAIASDFRREVAK